MHCIWNNIGGFNSHQTFWLYSITALLIKTHNQVRGWHHSPVWVVVAPTMTKSVITMTKSVITPPMMQCLIVIALGVSSAPVYYTERKRKVKWGRPGNEARCPVWRQKMCNGVIKKKCVMKKKSVKRFLLLSLDHHTAKGMCQFVDQRRVSKTGFGNAS